MQWQDAYKYLINNGKWYHDMVIDKAHFLLDHNEHGTLLYTIYQSPDGSLFTDKEHLDQMKLPYFTGLKENNHPICTSGGLYPDTILKFKAI